MALVHHVDRHQAKEIANSLISLMQDFKFHEAGESLQIFFSIGIAVFDNGLQTADDIFLQADSAVHEAKSCGRNRYSLYESSHDAALLEKDLGWHERLSTMLRDESLVLYYQPLSSLNGSGQQICEVLLRMPDESREVLLPSAFFPAAERFGLMAELDRQVIRKAASWLSNLNSDEVMLSINVSLQSFEESEAFVAFLISVIDEFQLNTNQFTFEIDETVAVRNSDKLRPVVEQIRQLGCRFAIDNFGAGYASFDYIKHCPADILNIHHSLIENLAQELLSQITLRAIVEAAHLLGKQTVAKFVQDERTIQLLREMGFDYAQGYYLSEALPVEPKTAPKLSIVK